MKVDKVYVQTLNGMLCSMRVASYWKHECVHQVYIPDVHNHCPSSPVPATALFTCISISAGQHTPSFARLHEAFILLSPHDPEDINIVHQMAKLRLCREQCFN